MSPSVLQLPPPPPPISGPLELEFVAGYAGTARNGTAHVTGVRVLDPLYAGERHYIPLVEGGERRQNTDASSHAANDHCLGLLHESRGLVREEARIFVEQSD